MHVHRRLALLLGRLGLFLQLFGLGHDRFLFALVTVDFLEISRLLVAGGQRRSQFGEILLAPLRLIEIPLVGSFGPSNSRFVLEKQRIVLRRPTHISEQCTDGGEDRRHDGNSPGEGIMQCAVLGLVLMRAMDVKMIFGHATLPGLWMLNVRISGARSIGYALIRGEMVRETVV